MDTHSIHTPSTSGRFSELLFNLQDLPPDIFDPTPQEREEAFLKECLEQVKKLQSFTSKTRRSCLSIKNKNPKTTLGQGVYTPIEYAKFLTAYIHKDSPSSQTRFDYMVQKNMFLYGRTPTCFECVPFEDPQSKTTKQWFVAKEGVSGVWALAKILEGPTLLAPEDAIKIAQYQALKAVLDDDDKFNKICEVAQLCFSASYQHDPINYLYVDREGDDLSQQPLKVGEQVIISGFTKYADKHPHGHGTKYPFICADATPGKEKFSNAQMSQNSLSGIREIIVREYNSPPVSLELFLPESRIPTSPERMKRKISGKKLRKSGGGKIIKVRGIDRERLHSLAKTSSSKVKDLMFTWIEESKRTSP